MAFDIQNGVLVECISEAGETEVVIPDSVTEIGQGAFAGCDNLTVHTPCGSYAESYCRENGILVENEI